jgi:preprotein translocase subunit SecA
VTLADRAVATLGFHLQQLCARRLPEAVGAPSAGRGISELRYGLRRDGLKPALLGECFSLYAKSPASHVRAAAERLAAGGVVELADPAERHEALALAALAHALHGGGVHLIAASEPAAKALQGKLGARFAALGLRVALVEQGMNPAARREAYASDVVCGTHREIAQDHLRDRLAAGERGGAVARRVQRLSSPGDQELMPQGLHCALVDDADIVMLDDALAPAAIATEVDQSRERLLYEQALELARALKRDADFTVDHEGIRLTEPAARLLERLVTPLGGIWSARQRREELVGLALEALHLLERDVDYRVANGRVQFPERRKDGEDAADADQEVQKLVEVKEGCRLGARRELLARLPMPRFFARYRHLAGACADARALESEFWDLYSLKTWLAGERLIAPPPALRVFASGEARNAALVELLRAHTAAGRTVVLAVRSAREAQALQGMLQEAQVGGDVKLAVLPAVQSLPAQRQASLVVAGLPDCRRHIELARRACGAASSELLFALDEEAVASRLGVFRFSRFFVRPDGELVARAAGLVARHAQRAAERASRGGRLDLHARERMLDDLLAFSGQRD